MATDTFNTKLNLAIANADAATLLGEDTRKQLRRKLKPGADSRQEQLDAALDGLSTAGATLRSFCGMLQWPQFEIAFHDEERLRRSSERLDRERRKLRKMARDPEERAKARRRREKEGR